MADKLKPRRRLFVIKGDGTRNTEMLKLTYICVQIIFGMSFFLQPVKPSTHGFTFVTELYYRYSRTDVKARAGIRKQQKS